jgi:hypothetical protein
MSQIPNGHLHEEGTCTCLTNYKSNFLSRRSLHTCLANNEYNMYWRSPSTDYHNARGMTRTSQGEDWCTCQYIDLLWKPQAHSDSGLKPTNEQQKFNINHILEMASSNLPYTFHLRCTCTYGKLSLLLPLHFASLISLSRAIVHPRPKADFMCLSGNSNHQFPKRTSDTWIFRVGIDVVEENKRTSIR